MKMLKKQLRRACEKNPLYGLSLFSRETLDFSKMPHDPWPSNTTFSLDILYELTVWDNFYFNSFEWIRDFKSINDITIRSKIRDIINFWTVHFHKVFSRSWLQWEPSVTGYRLWNWIALFDFYGLSGSEEFKSEISKSIIAQAKHLMRSWDDSVDPLMRFRALKGIIGYLAITNPNRIEKWVDALEETLNEQCFEDGGHKSRDPITQLLLLRDLIDIRNIFTQFNVKGHTLAQRIAFVAPIVRLFRHGDGKLSRFEGFIKEKVLEPSPAFIDMCLSLSDVRRRPPTFVEHMGYMRCVNKSGVLLFSTNPLESNNLSTGLFQFEWSYDRQMVLESGDLIVENMNRDYWHAPLDGATKVERSLCEDYAFIDASYESEPLAYARHLYFDEAQVSLCGEEKVTFHEDGWMAIRFVLASDLEVVPTSKTTKSFILKLNALNVNNIKKLTRITTLQFVATGCHDLIYQPAQGDEQHSLILLSCLDAHKESCIKWRFHLNV